jgi:thiamine-phosphate pyrophosphorylase
MMSHNLKNKLHGLYLVTPDWDDTERLLKLTEQACRGGASLVQYRHKTASTEQRREQASALLKLCRQFAIPFIINDHIDLCLALDADGVHVGGKDLGVAQVRALIGDQKILGASCYGDWDLALSAQAAGASYVAFGGFYPSLVKKYPVTTPVTIVQQAKAQLQVPNVVIGGMTVENSRVLVDAGADMVAAISSVYLSEDPELEAQRFTCLFNGSK